MHSTFSMQLGKLHLGQRPGEEQSADLLGGGGAVEVGDVSGVGVEGESDGGVAESGADNLRVDSGAQTRVPQLTTRLDTEMGG